MIDHTHALPAVRQAELAGLSRASVFYLPRVASEADQRLMKRIDIIHLEYPFAGARMLRDLLAREGFNIGRRHVGTLMAKMGIEAMYRKPNTSRRAPGHTIWPYLLRGLEIERANQVWATDIIYIPMARGFLYLAAAIDWHGRRVLAWRLSTSMDGKGCWRDNVFFERARRSIKYDEGYLYACQAVRTARDGIGCFLNFCDTRRPHSNNQARTPDVVYLASLPQPSAQAA